jgi:Rrf2 family transcriptional regulator, iron-sulfur cluster assembly transcription factor
MLITRETDYAIRCTLLLAAEHGSVSAKEIARRMRIPAPFVSKILQKLSQAGMVSSVRGARGGFALTSDAASTTLLDIVVAVQGRVATNSCAVNERRCSLSRTCAAHPVWVELRTVIEERLRNENLAGLVQRGLTLARAARRPITRGDL